MNTDKTAFTLLPKAVHHAPQNPAHPAALLTLASPALADADKALLAKCDMGRNGVIISPANDLPPAAWAVVVGVRGEREGSDRLMAGPLR